MYQIPDSTLLYLGRYEYDAIVGLNLRELREEESGPPKLLLYLLLFYILCKNPLKIYLLGISVKEALRSP